MLDDSSNSDKIYLIKDNHDYDIEEKNLTKELETLASNTSLEGWSLFVEFAF